MEIEEIKAQLSIDQVLSHYNLSPNRNGMLNCPFHSDKKASMKVYEETNTVYCFAGSCDIESLDVIDFIMTQEKVSKGAAITKAKSLCGSLPKLPSRQLNAPAVAHPAHEFRSYHKSLHAHKLSQEYCESRCLDWHQLEIGYKSRKSSDRWGRGCIIFPLLNGLGEIVSLYGRAIKGSSHFYQTDRKGLYPGYPLKSTKVLLLSESIVDTATLIPLNLLLENYALLALYGTNGLTDEHIGVIKQLPVLEEIIFAFDGDAAGRSATGDHGRTLSRLHPKVKQSYLQLPAGEDINSLATSHEHYEQLLQHLIQDRKSLGNEKPVKEKAPPAPSTPITPELQTQDSSNLIYSTTLATYFIKGGVRCTHKDLHNLKITLVVENEKGKKSRNGLDLYEDRQIEKTARHVADRLNLRADLIELDLHALTDELENYRKAQLQSTGLDRDKKVQLNPTRRSLCLAFWQHKNLLHRIDAQLENYGIIGENNNRRLGFCIASSSRMREPLHGLIQGSSGSGKTHLLSALCALIPPEWYIPITRATDNSFYNFQRYELRHKLISVEDKDTMSDEANLAFRELQSKGMLSQSTTGQDENGHNRSYIREVYGPIASLACTTKGELYLDDMNRCFLLAVDESDEQTKRILAYQKRRAAGEVDSNNKEEIAAFMQDALRLLQSYEVVIPQATKLSLPSDVKDKRRLNSLYLSLVKQITLLHQYQRQKDDKSRLIATLEDLKCANEILFDAIVLKVDDLHGPLRSFYEKLKCYLVSKAKDQAPKYAFRQREIRQELRLSRTGIYNYLKELLEMEYLQIVGGSDRRGYNYKVSYWDDNESLRKRIQKHLNDQISQLQCSSVFK